MENITTITNIANRRRWWTLMSGTLYVCFILPSCQPYKVAIYYLVLQKKKQRLREIKLLVQVHIGREWVKWKLNPSRYTTGLQNCYSVRCNMCLQCQPRKGRLKACIRIGAMEKMRSLPWVTFRTQWFTGCGCKGRDVYLCPDFRLGQLGGR